MTVMKTRVSSGDLMRELGVSRAVLDRLIRDWGRELPAAEIVAGSRLWPTSAVDEFRAILKRDQEVGR
jgi:hypothetical protein